MTDHHIRLLFIISIQALFLVFYAAALSEMWTTFKKKEYIAAIARPVFCLFVISINALYVKYLVDEDRRKTYAEYLLTEMVLDRKAQQQRQDSLYRELNLSILDFKNQVKARTEILKQSNYDLRELMDIQKKITSLQPTHPQPPRKH